MDAERANQRGSVDIETLEEVNQRLISTLMQTVQIQQEGRAARVEAENRMRQDRGRSQDSAAGECTGALVGPVRCRIAVCRDAFAPEACASGKHARGHASCYHEGGRWRDWGPVGATTQSSWCVVRRAPLRGMKGRSDGFEQRSAWIRRVCWCRTGVTAHGGTYVHPGARCSRAQPQERRRRHPLGCLVGIAGVSGSGKSSLALRASTWSEGVSARRGTAGSRLLWPMFS